MQRGGLASAAGSRDRVPRTQHPNRRGGSRLGHRGRQKGPGSDHVQVGGGASMG